MNLYDIDERLKVLEEYGIDSETGEILSEEDFYKLYDEIQMDLNTKIENTICFVKNLRADCNEYKLEEDRIKQRRKIKENLADRLESRINYYIKQKFTDEDGNIDTDGLSKYKLETAKMKLSYRKSQTANITDINKLPKEYIKEEVIVKPLLNDIKKAIKNGKNIDGAELKTNYNMQVK